MAVQILSVESTELFVGSPDAPDQLVVVELTGDPGPVTVAAAVPRGEPRPGVEVELTGAGPVRVEVPVRFAPGTPADAAVPTTVTATADDGATATADATILVAEPGWTMHMVSHFHYDPVWWNTQAAYTSEWVSLDWAGSPKAEFQHAGFDLVRAHLDMARHDPDYKFVLAEVDYLKPYWDAFPADRAILRRLLAEGRCELLGGTYNEPNTNLTSAESTIRNLVHGVGYQRDVLGGAPATAWQLDAFGHDPQFPGLAADAGLTASSWARGPFHQWGPLQRTPAEPFGDPHVMQFPSEFEWVAPSGRGLLTSYMPAHYSAGWWMDSAPTLAEAEATVYRIFLALKQVAATRHVLLPVGTDYSPPNKWVTEIHRDWAARYVWPRFVCALPRDFLDAVRAETERDGRRFVPVTRDMNPIYTGKDVSFVDTKQAQRQAEVQLADAERFATFAALYGAKYPAAALDKAWRQLVYGAHHDGITGSESDQVYLDLLTGWREAWQLGRDVRDAATAHLAARVDTTGEGRAVLVVNGLSWPRTDVVRLELPAGTADPGFALADPETGVDVPFVVEALGDDGSATISFVARDVPPTGWRGYRLVPTEQPLEPAAWRSTKGRGAPVISNERYAITVSEDHGGGVVRLVDRLSGRDVLPPGEVGNTLLVYDEYPQHPTYGEGPWHLLPKGPPKATSADREAEVRMVASPVGSRLVITGEVDTVRYEQTITLWTGVPRVDCDLRLDFAGSDQLVRLRWPTAVRGGLPVSEVGNAVIGRGFGIVDVDTADQPWTLDNPAYSWFGVSATARVILGETARALGVAEVVAPGGSASSPEIRDLVVGLVRAGVTSTTSVDAGSRYGHLDVDSNLPDVRVSVGGPDRNVFTAAVLAEADPAFGAELRRQLDATGRGRVWVPAERPLGEVWGGDLRGARALPVLILAGTDDAALAAELEDVVSGLADATIFVEQPAELTVAEPGLDDYSVALLNRGMPGFAVDPGGALHLSLLRSCTGWPSGVWIDPPKRSAPDGSGFQLQHWTHAFGYALTSGAGDWRDAGFVPAGQGYTAPLAALVTDAHPGRLAATTSLLTVEPADAAVVTAVKPAGNPLAAASVAEVDPANGVTVRLYEPNGRPAEVTLRVPYGLAAASTTDLLEERPRDALTVHDDATTVPLTGAEVVTLGLAPTPLVWRDAGTADRPALASDLEPAQPVYSRYWLHNAGPAPTGGLPVTVHATVHESTEVRFTVASSLTDGDWTGVATVVVPDGWTVSPAQTPLSLPPGGHAELTARVTPAADAAPGDHLVAVEITDQGQRVQDVVRVSVPGAFPGATSPGAVEVELETPALSVRPGGRTVLRAVLTNGFRSAADAVLWLIGPVETWVLTPEWTRGVRLGADERVTVDLPIEVPADAAPGSWWLLVKLGCAGTVRYTASVRLTVDPPRRSLR